MRLNDLLNVLEFDTFIKIQWLHEESFEYVGSVEDCYLYDEDCEEDLIVENINVNQDGELIIVITVNIDED